ncbi:MAG: hypothetical protein HUN04_08570 [Desulfobacter sp.]|nr:MAG: hypothetical protein HUN04_08570 [Desulfobacter sp.]
MTNPHICAQCDATNRSCCTLRAEDNDGMPTPVSEPEVVKILAAQGHQRREEILDIRPNSEQFTHQMTLLFPDMADYIHHAFPMSGHHMELKTQGDACIFKDDQGCLLPNEARPHFCRIYPFWFFGSEPQIFQDHNCLALQKNRTIPEVLLSLGTNADTLRRIHNRICRDWGLYRSIPQKQKRAFL